MIEFEVEQKMELLRRGSDGQNGSSVDMPQVILYYQYEACDVDIIHIFRVCQFDLDFVTFQRVWRVL